MTDVSKVPAVIRNSKGLVDTLFNTIDRLNANEINAEHARAVSHTAKTIVGIARLEMEFRKGLADNGLKLTSLIIDATPKPEKLAEKPAEKS